MEYYIYVSDTKVDMLYDQIPTRLRDKLATELKIDLKVLSTTFSEQPAEATRFSKLKVVTEFIEKHKLAGTVDSPAAYFRGTMQMRWGPHPLEQEMVYFGGMTDHTILGLIGSMKHIIGNQGDAFVHSFSGADALVAVLRMEQQMPILESSSLLIEVYETTTYMEGPKQQLKFLAKRLADSNDYLDDEAFTYTYAIHRDDNPEKRILLGSPIYVALAD